MFWTTVLLCFLAAVAGLLAFWLVYATRITPLFLSLAGPVLMIVAPPHIVLGALTGAWLAAAFFPHSVSGLPAPKESMGWRRVLRDALGVTLAVAVGLIYMYRQRAAADAGTVVGVGLAVTFYLILCHLYTLADEIPKEMRVKYGYAVGFISFLPWVFLLFRLGWTFVVLGFLSFFLGTPFLLAAADLRVRMPARRRGTYMTIHLPRR